MFLYVVWQILTRSDDHEILSHMSAGPPLSQPAFERQPAAPQQQYHLPYQLPQLASPISTTTEATATWRIVINALVYPIYIAITLIAIPMPFLISGLNLVFSIINTILYPITSTVRLLARTFILTPLNVVRGFLLALYPVYVFVGGVVGTGALLGIAFGWAGRVLTNLLVRPSQPRRRRSKRSKTQRAPRERSSSRVAADPTFVSSRSRPSSMVYEGDTLARQHSRPVSGVFDPTPERVRSRPVSGVFENAWNRPSFDSRSRPVSGSYERRYLPIVDVVEIDDDMFEYEGVHTTAREGAVVGVRRRGGVRHEG